MTRALSILTAFALLLLTARAHAHASRTALLELTVTSTTTATVTIRTPPGAHLALRADDCEVRANTGLLAMGTTSAYAVRCAGGMAGAALTVEGLGLGADLAVVHLRGSDQDEGAVLSQRSPSYVVPARGAGGAVLGRYARLGAEHVLSGADHVAFLAILAVQALVATAGALRKAALELARTATAFTLAHTITLSATALGVLRVPAPAAEGCIAATLVLAALDLRALPGSAASHVGTRSSRTALAFAFGLVHGLGFASALAGGRLPQRSVALGLLGFNLGVELGQALVLAGCLALVSVLRRLTSAPLRADRAALAGTVVSYAVGAFGVYLLLSRVPLRLPLL